MAVLSAGLFGETVDFLSKYFRTSAERDAILLPVLSQWPGRAGIDYDGSARKFAVELVEKLPAEQLKAVLRGLPTGVEQGEQALLLCLRIDAEDGLTGPDPLASARRMAPPARRADDAPSVLFRPAALMSGPALAAAEPVEHFRELLDAQRPLVLVTDFAADVQPALLAVSEGAGDAVWIDGEPLLGPAGPARYRKPGYSQPGYGVPAYREAAGHAEISGLPASLLLIDCSSARPERLLAVRRGRPGEPDATGDAEPEVLLEAFLTWAASRGHRLVLGLPRWAWGRSAEALRRRSAQVLTAAELFSERYRYRAEECERRLGRRLPFRSVLFPLLSANSATLPRATAEILRGLPTRPAFVDSVVDEPEKTAVALKLARLLMEAGFHEIAYRIEGHCRTVPRQRGVVALAADLRLDPEARPEDAVVGFVESTAEIPAMVRHGTLTGGTGAGKTTSLLSIEHRWFVPRIGEAGVRARHYLPLYVPLDENPDPDLVGRIEAHLGREAFAWFEDGSERFPLPCHALVGRLGSLHAVRALFSSPLYLLLDDVHRLSLAEQDRLSQDLSRRRTEDPAMGALLACRDERTAGLLKLSVLTVRELSEQQIRALLEERRGDLSLLNLMGAHGAPISKHIRNPLVLSLLCELALTDNDLAGAGLRTVLEFYVARWGSALGIEDRVRRDAEVRLAAVALELKRADARQKRSEDPADQELIATGRLLGLLREVGDAGVLEFRFDLLRDYFAARQLAKDIGRSGVAAVFGRSARTDSDWHDLLRILVSLLKEKDAGIVVEHLFRTAGPRTAHECLLELPGRVGRTTSAALSRGSVTAADGLDERIEDLRTLGRLDPRIAVGAPLRTMVDVPRSELMDSFRIGKYPVTNMEFAEFVLGGGYDNDDWWDDLGWNWIKVQKIRFPRYWLNSRLNLPNQPVTGVSLFEAKAYCAWLTHRRRGHVFRLPSAVEWDSAAHGSNQIFELVLTIARGTRSRTPAERARIRQDGPLVLTDLREWIGEDGALADLTAAQLAEAGVDAGTGVIPELVGVIQQYMEPYRHGLEHVQGAPVGVFPPNRLGIHDLFGNVWQWCDTTMSMTSATETELMHRPRDPRTRRGKPAVVKGGAMSGAHNPVWSLVGGWFDPFVRFHRLGFRVSCRAA
ncbi:SUMF1/EgtB/PvdO family nonheme iron enzyme [Streptomyces sp. SD15]